MIGAKGLLGRFSGGWLAQSRVLDGSAGAADSSGFPGGQGLAPAAARSRCQTNTLSGGTLSGGTTEAHAILRGVTRRYDGKQPIHALGPIDLELARGEFFSVVGPSGCGKSTLLDVLSGLGVASAGSVSFEGKPVTGEVPDGVGVVFQEDSSFPWLTTRDNVAFGLRRSGLPRAQINTQVDEAIAFMGLSYFAGHYPAQLSGGMRQRVCIARTLVQQPRLLLLDEPFGALDQQTRLLMGDALLRVWRQTGATVLLITHALDEAAMLSDRVGVMSARPGTFIDLMTTGWPRDRDSRVVAEPHFGEMTARLWTSLRGESLRSMGHVV